MKKITAFIMVLLLLCNAFAIELFAASLKIQSVYPENKTSYAEKEDVQISGICTPGNDVVVRIYNDNDSLVFTDVILAEDVVVEESSENQPVGKFVFEGYQTPKMTSKGTFEYTVVVSESGNDEAASEPVTETIKIVKESSGSSSVGPSVDEPKKMTSWVAEQSEEKSTEKADEEKNEAHTDPLNYDDLWDVVNGVKNTKEADNVIDTLTKETDKETMKGETARNNVATAVEVMVANISSKNVKVSTGNKLNLKASSVSENDLSKLENTMEAIKKSVADNKITLNRDLSKELVLNVTFNSRTKATVTISKELVDKLIEADVGILTLKDTDFTMSYTIADLVQILGEKTEVSLELDKSGITTKKISITFDTDNTQSVKIAFPKLSGDTKYMAVVDEEGNPVGGRYNPTSGVVEAKINESGIYQLVSNEKNFDDIKDKSNEMQESIKILAAKGIIEGTSEKTFSPDDTITRAEVAALLLRVLSLDDPNADSGFEDVKKSDWFYGTAGSSKKYGMILGFEDNTFRGRSVIKKDQILTIASRILKKEMRYKVPENLGEWLTFSDVDQIALWAKEDVALATMANIITRSNDNMIRSNDEMSRGEAALIVMRLFYKVW